VPSPALSAPARPGPWRRLRRLLGTVRRLITELSRDELGHAFRIVTETRSARARRLSAVQGALTHGAGRLIFVCYGNIMRSAFAAAQAVDRAPALAPRIRGAGTHATPGREAHADAREAAHSFGVDLSAHRAARLGELRVASADVLVCMDLANAARASALPGADARRVFLVGDVGEGPRQVADPYGHGLAVTHEAFRRVATLGDAWLTRLSSPAPAAAAPAQD